MLYFFPCVLIISEFEEFACELVYDGRNCICTIGCSLLMDVFLHFSSGVNHVLVYDSIMYKWKFNLVLTGYLDFFVKSCISIVSIQYIWDTLLFCNVDLYFSMCVAGVPLAHSLSWILLMIVSIFSIIPSLRYVYYSGILISDMLSIGCLESGRWYDSLIASLMVLTVRLTVVFFPWC